MENKKRAQEISIQTIVIVALAVLVLIVIAVIFTQRFGKGQEQINVVTNPLEYKAACLAKNQNDVPAYEACVKRCEDAAKSTPPKALAECSLTQPKK